MRLVCPNCDAQYELGQGALTDAGRDVQCSNCGHTWFQLPPELEAEREAEEELFGKSAPVTPSRAPTPRPETPRTVTSPVKPPPVAHQAPADASFAKPLDRQGGGEPSVQNTTTDHAAHLEQQEIAATLAAAAEDQRQAVARAAALKRDAATQSPPEPQPDVPAHPETAAQPQPPAAPRRALDESLKAVLREEAEREVSVRRSQTPRPLETQTDLGLQDTAGGAGATKAVRDRLARLRGQEPEPEPNDKPTARRDLLPDIEEINSTLRASSENRRGDEALMTAEETDAADANTGFRSGFSLMLLLAVVLIAAYVAAPKIIDQFPAAESAMNSYVAWVDVARVWLDNAMRNAIATLQNLTSGSNS